MNTATPDGIASHPDYLAWIETPHRRNVGENFCYVAVRYHNSSSLWRLAIVEKNVAGYYPVSDDFFIGYKAEAEAKAVHLNRDRMSINRRLAAEIVASSMSTKAERAESRL